MKQDQTNIQELWELFISDKASLQQVNTLFEYINNATNDDENIAFFRQALNKIPRSFYKTDDEVVHSILDSIIGSDKDVKASIDNNTAVVPVRSICLPGKWGWAAASILLLLGIGSYFLFSKNKKQPIVAVSIPTDIAAPTSNRAMITLADGTKVFLDSVGNGQLAQQGAVKLIKLANGRIAYQPLGDGIASHDERDLSHIYNTLSNPRGSKIIDIALSDGSRVWLNAGSSLIYPTAFTGKERKVKITGEAYFEVAKMKDMPFHVTINDMAEVKVLGTHFNINAYEGEPGIKTTLLEGSIQTSLLGAGKTPDYVVLKPGQQAEITNKIKLNESVNTDQVMAWKNGLFNFENASLEEVMQQLSRWYDIEVVYEQAIPQMIFGGEMSRNVSLAGLLSGLERAGVRFRIEEGNRLIVMP